MTAATPIITTANEVRVRPSSAAGPPPRSRPEPATSPSTVIAVQSSHAAASPASVAATAPVRVTGPASSTSARPASSSPRSTRVVANMPQIPPTSASESTTRHSVKPAIVSSDRVSPKSAFSPGFDPMLRARVTRSAGSG